MVNISDQTSISLLHIEDDEDYRNLIVAMLKIEPASPFRLVSAATLGEGLEKLKTAHFDLVLLDWSLPDAMEGTESIRLIREVSPLVSIVVFTGYDDDRIVEQALAAGADSFLLKTFGTRAILIALHSAIANGQRRQEMMATIEGEITRLESREDQKDGKT